MQDFLAMRANTSPNATALIANGQTWTYAQLQQDTACLCAYLAHLGVHKGENVALLAPSSAETVIAIHALARLGAVLVPLNTRLTVTELALQIRLADCQRVLYGAGFADSAHALGITAHALPALDSLPISAEWQDSDAPLTATSALVFTSGTSGTPKAATLTRANFFYSAMASAYHIGTLPHDRWLCVLPLFHVGGLSIVYRACLYGIALDLVPKFDAPTLAQYLAQTAVTLISLVPTQVYRLLEADAPRPQALRLVLLGGAPADPTLVERATQAGYPIATTYGLTEACSQVATAPPDVVARKIGTVGKPLPFTQVQIVDENGQALPQGQVGEVVVRGLTVMAGYYGNPEATARTLRDGALHTGDIGYLDADGDLWLLQRRSDLIISGGENIYPYEIEALLKAHPTVKEACAVGVPSAEWGQTVGVAVVLKPAHTATPEELIDFLQGKLARYKQPRQLIIVPELPMTASGKVVRGDVRAWFTAN
jgi:O-succinylbenzoic acid--CoA ligase